MIMMKLVDSTNEAIFHKYQGYVGVLVFVAGSAWLMDLERLKAGSGYGGFHTSLILGYEKLSETLILFQTRNSEYVFEVVEGSFDENDPLLEIMIEQNKLLF